MKNLSKRILSYFPVIIFLAVCTVAIYVELESALRPVLYERFALDSPTFENGSNNAKPLISALKLYRLESQHYPLSLGELPATQDVFMLTFTYKYEPSPSAEEPQEYMLSFRKRWSTHDVYCYYSEDGVWLQSSGACWYTVRSTSGLKSSSEEYH